MIPIGADVHLRRKPIGNWILIGLNVLVYMLVNGFESRGVARLLPPLDGTLPSVAEFITYQFRHGDLMHLCGNMLFLWIFGSAVCDRMGSLNYILFYLAGGVIAGLTFSHYEGNKLVGASGSIAAVTTAFLVLFPRVHITMLVWFFIMTTIQLPAMLLITFKIILWDNILAPRLSEGAYSNVAYSAHLGGYVFGFVIALTLLLTRAVPRNQFDLLALWKRWGRRTGIPEIAPRGGMRPAPVEEVASRPLEELKLTPAEQLREDILSRLAEHDFNEAARLYEELVRLDPQATLPRSQQLEMANHFARIGQHRMAAEAYEAFLAAYPTSPDAVQVRLLAGLICKRYLHEYERAIEHLRSAEQDLTREPQRELARTELADAEALMAQRGG